MPLDNQNLITTEEILEVEKLQSLPSAFEKYYKDLRVNEPKAFAYLTQSVMNEISKLSMTFEGVQEGYPLLSIYLKEVLTSLTLRAMLLGELKWRPQLPETCVLDSTYKIDPKDFD